MLNFILMKAFEMRCCCIFAPNTSLLALIEQETCFTTAPCAQASNNFSPNSMTFWLPAVLRQSTLGKLTSSYARPSLNTNSFCGVSVRVLQLHSELQPCYCSLTSFMSLLASTAWKQQLCPVSQIHTPVTYWAKVVRDTYCTLLYTLIVFFMVGKKKKNSK